MISAAELANIRKAMARIDDSTKETIGAVIDEVGISDADKLRTAILEQLAPVMQEASALSAELAAALYNGWRYQYLSETIDTVTESAYDYNKVEAMANTAAKRASEGATVDQVKDIVVRRAMYDTRKSYGDTMIGNARNDTANVRFARVPTHTASYTDGCPFCQMLASRGFVYYSKATAGQFNHYHADCSCQVVASFEKSPVVEGYDPEAYYEAYQASKNKTDI